MKLHIGLRDGKVTFCGLTRFTKNYSMWFADSVDLFDRSNKWCKVCKKIWKQNKFN